MKMRLQWLGLVMVLLIAGCAQNATTTTSTAAGLEIKDVWVRAASMNSDASMGTDAQVTSAAYLTIQNTGAADKLIKVESDIAQSVELHNVSDMNGMMQMRPVDGVDEPANSMVQLKPGSYHIMLVGLKRDLKSGDTVDLTLTFQKAGKQVAHATVRAQ